MDGEEIPLPVERASIADIPTSDHARAHSNKRPSLGRGQLRDPKRTPWLELTLHRAIEDRGVLYLALFENVRSR
jgi:hypothetical protein